MNDPQYSDEETFLRVMICVVALGIALMIDVLLR